MGKSVEIESSLEVAGGERKGHEDWFSMGTGFILRGGYKNVLKLVEIESVNILKTI